MRVTVFVHPNSRKPRVETDLLGDLHVHVNAPPLEGRANQATAMALAEYFKVAKSRVVLVRGAKAKQKTFEIS